MGADSGAFEVASTELDSLQAFERIEPELGGLGDDELVPINIDILVAVTTVLGAVPRLREFRAQLVSALPGFDAASFDRLEVYARAAGHAHARHLQVTSSPELTPLLEAAVKLREQLLADTTALVRRGLVPDAVLGSLKGPVGHRNLAFDLSALSNWLRESWSSIEGKTAIAPGEIGQARVLADQLLTAVGVREAGTSGVSRSALTRQRAFTLLVRAYDQVRRGMTYLRWNEGDVDELAPSLYEKRGARRRERAETPAPVAVKGVEARTSEGKTSEVKRVEGAPLSLLNGSSKVGTSSGLPGESPFEDP